jgi:amino acid adenylation domain-containing protein
MKYNQTLGSILASRFDGERCGATALEHRARSISYREVATAAQSIADVLKHLDVKKGTHVGILADDSSLIVPTMIGLLAHGCVFALLDSAHPPNYLRELADAADLEYLFVEDKLLSLGYDVFRGKSGKTLAINEGIYSTSDQPCSVSTLLAQRTEQASYIYFSSGTSGTPKPILGRTDSLMHFVNWEVTVLGLDETVRVSQLTSPSHDPYLRDVFTPLSVGGTICIPDSRHIVLSPFELGQWLDETGIDLIHCTPTVFRNLCNGGLNGRTFGRLKHVLIAGEQLRGVHLTAWYKAVGDRVKLVNLYGPTETTLAKLHYFISPEDVGRAAIPIGQPINGANARIMATPFRECNVGEIGELYIETAFATMGYYRRPELNREAFDPDPTASLDCPVVYKTGDLVRQLPDGNIEFVGRKDELQKVRGKQIDLGRVEDEIIKRTEIHSCIVSVMASDDAGGTDRLVVYYVADRDIEEKVLKQRLTRDLPKYMTPDVWIRVESLPTHANGKMHGHELATLFSKYDSVQGLRGVRDPQEGGGTEDYLLTLWRELLRNDSIGLDDPFMEVGGDSLSIMLLIGRLDQECGYNLSLWQIFDSLTVRKLASSIDGVALQ